MTVTGDPAAATDEAAVVAAPSRRSVWFGAARSGAVRMLVLPLSAILGVLVTRVIVENYGTAAFAQYGLLVTIGSLLPFTDLGVSAAVMNAVGASTAPGTDDRVRRVLVTAIRVLIGSAVVLSVIAVATPAAGLWPTLLGPGLLPGAGPLVAMTCLVLIAVTMPFGIGQRILAGLGKNHLAIAVGGLQTPLVLGTLLVLLHLHVPAGAAVPVIAYGATLVLSAPRSPPGGSAPSSGGPCARSGGCAPSAAAACSTSPGRC
jgi:Na+-driven multidrug efflux pump